MPLRSERAPANSESGARAARVVPVLTIMLAAILALEPVPLPGYAALTPVFTLMALYHWMIYRPELVPPITLFAIGVGYDLLCGGPPGVTPLLLLLARAAVLHARRWFLDRGFAFVWTGFALLTVGAVALLWALECVLAWQLLGIADSLFRAAVTAALFPIASFVLGRTQHALMGAD